MKLGRAPISIAVLLLAVSAATALPKPDGLRQASAVTSIERKSETITLRSTDRLPEASGEARVERRGGTTFIDVELNSMKPAWLFGGDYNTYVVWVVPPEGPAKNLGDLHLDGSEAALRGQTTAATFAIVVTAEPHYLVNIPSAFVILQNKSDSDTIQIRYPVVEGVYNFERTTLEDVKEAKGRVHSEVKQAFTAVRLAQRAGAPALVPEEFAKAERALDQTLHLSHERVNRTEIAAQARETVRLAVAAQRLASDRAFQARVEAEGSGGGNGEAGRRDPRGTK